MEFDKEAITSEEYEEKARKAIDVGEHAEASAYATLSLSATIREVAFIMAELIDPLDDDDDEESDDD